MLALERIAKSRSEHLFPLVTDALRYLVDDGTYDQRRPMYILILYRRPTSYQSAHRNKTLISIGNEK